MLSEEKNKEINKLTKEVNDLFRKRNYYSSIMDGYSHLHKNKVKPEHDGDNPKYEDEKDFMYPTVGEFKEAWQRDEDKATFAEGEKPIPGPDAKCDDEYRDFMSLINYKKKKGSELFFNLNYEDGDYQIDCENSEGKLLRLSGDRLFHFNQLVSHLYVDDKEKAFSRLGYDPSQTLINTFIKASALPGNYIFWRVTDEGQGKGINSLRSSTLQGDRFDLALKTLRQWFGPNRGGVKEKDKLFDAFKTDGDNGYPLFSKRDESGWKYFVEFFELKGSFVDGDYQVYNQASDPFKRKMEVFPVDDIWEITKLKDSWSDPKLGEGIPPEIENYLINGIKTIIKRTERLNEVLHRA